MRARSTTSRGGSRRRGGRTHRWALPDTPTSAPTSALRRRAPRAARSWLRFYRQSACASDEGFDGGRREPPAQGGWDARPGLLDAEMSRLTSCSTADWGHRAQIGPVPSVVPVVARQTRRAHDVEREVEQAEREVGHPGQLIARRHPDRRRGAPRTAPAIDDAPTPSAPAAFLTRPDHLAPVPSRPGQGRRGGELVVDELDEAERVLDASEQPIRLRALLLGLALSRGTARERVDLWIEPGTVGAPH